MRGAPVKLHWHGSTPKKTTSDSDGMVTSVNVGTASSGRGASGPPDSHDPAASKRISHGGTGAFVESGPNATAEQIDKGPVAESKVGRMRMNRT